MSDATLVRAHRHSAGARKRGARTSVAPGRRRGGLSTEIHAEARGTVSHRSSR